MLNILDIIYQEIDKEDPYISSTEGVWLNPSSSGVYDKNGVCYGACSKRVFLDKKGFPKSNPVTTYNKLQFELGKLYEKWVIDNLSKSGIELEHNVKVKNEELKLSGEIDVILKHPETKEESILEIKTYNGSFFQNAKEVLGSKDNLPTPKVAYILQCVSYLLMKPDIKYADLLYIDKSGAKLYNSKQFRVYIENDFIFYNTLYEGKLVTIKEDRFKVSDIIERNKILLELIDLDYVPEPSYKMTYDKYDIEEAYKLGEISKSKYEAYKKSPMTNELGSWQCQYCPYGKGPDGDSTCINVTNETKEFFRS